MAKSCSLLGYSDDISIKPEFDSVYQCYLLRPCLETLRTHEITCCPSKALLVVDNAIEASGEKGGP